VRQTTLSSGELTPRGYPGLLRPSIELVENPGELPPPSAQPVAPCAVPLGDPGIDQLTKPRREDGGTDPGPLSELREGVGAPAQLPDQPESPAPPEQVKD